LKDHDVGDILGVLFKTVKVANVSLLPYTKAKKKDQDIKVDDKNTIVMNFH
jgi:ribosomal protein S12